MSSPGTQSTNTVTNSQPPQEVMDAYRALMGRATGVANTPYTPYTGPNMQVYSPPASTGQSAQSAPAPTQQPQQFQQPQAQFVPTGEGAGYFTYAPQMESAAPTSAAPATGQMAPAQQATGATPQGLTYGNIASQLVANQSPYTVAAEQMSAYSPLQPYLNAGTQYGLNVGANAQDAAQIGNQANQTLQSFGQNVYGQLANYGLSEANQLGGQGAVLGQGIQNYAGQMGQNIANYGTAAGQNAAQYGTQQGQGLTQYGKAIGQGISDYGTQQGQNLANYGTQAGQGISQFGTQAGQNIANTGQSGGQSISNYALGQAAAGPQSQQFSGNAVGQYMSPYNQAVINSTLANINQQNAIDQNNLIGRAISSGNAFGGDRAGLAAAELARNQSLAKNQTIAGLENQNYAQALGQFNTNNAQALAGSQLGLSGLTTGQQLGLGAQTTGAQLGIGAQTTGAQLGVGAQGQGAQIGLGAQETGGQLGVNAKQQGAQLGTSALLSGSQLGLSGQQGGYGLGLQGVQSGVNTQMQGLQAGVNAGLQGIGQGAQVGLSGLQSGNQLGLTGQQLGLAGNSTAAGLMGNLGQLAQSGNLQNQQALYAAGAQDQTQQQNLLNAAYQQYQQAQGYPFSTTQFLANTLLGTGSAMGGTSSSTGTAPAPNQTGQYLGLGLGGLGLLGGLGFLARGGRVGYADGGSIDTAGKVFASPEDQEFLNADAPLTPERAGSIYDAYVRAGGGKDVSDSQFVKNSQFGIYPWSQLINYLSAINLRKGGRVPLADGGSVPFSVPWIPVSGLPTLGKGPPAPGSLPSSPKDDSADAAKILGTAKMVSDIGKNFKQQPQFASGMSGPISGGGLSPSTDIGGNWINPDNFDLTLGSGAMFNRGGLVPHYADGGMATSGLADPEIGQMAANVASFADAFRGMRHRAMGGTVMPSAVPMHFDDGGDVPTLDQQPDAPLVPGDQAPPLGAPINVPSLGLGDDAIPAAAQPVSYNSPFAGAISKIESGGRYDVVGPATQDGDRALGKYQVMGKNIGPWTKEVLGQPMTPQEFLSNPAAQDAVFNAKFGQYAQKYGPEGAARAWFAGEGGMNDPGRKDVLGTTVADYANKFISGLGGQTGGLSQPSNQPNTQPGNQPSQPNNQPQSGNFIDKFTNSPWGALAMIGASMAASKSPYIGAQLGEGILGGLSSYEAARKLSLDADRVRAQMQREDLQQQESARHNRATEGLGQQQLQRQMDIARIQSLQPVKIGTDILGHDIYGIRDPKSGLIQIIDPNTGKVLPPGAPIGGSPTSSATPPQVTGGDDDASIPAKAKPTQGGFPDTDWKPSIDRNEEFLSSLPASVRNTIKNIADYKINPQSLGYKDRTNYVNLATQYDPSYDQTRFRTINDTRKNFTGSGVEARNFQSNDMAIKHIGSGLDNIEALGNFTYLPSVANPVRGAVMSQVDPKYQEARKNLEVDIDAVANELMRTFRGSGSASEKEATEWRSKFPINGSPVEQRAAMAEAARLLASRVTAAGNRFNDAMGPANARDPLSWLSKEGQDVTRFATSLDPQQPVPKNWRLVESGLHPDKSPQQAPQQSQQPQQPVNAGAPAVGEIRKGYRFKGGDWKKRENWERVQ